MLRKPQMLLIPEPWCNKNSMIINLQRGAVEQEEDARVPAAAPRYTIKLLGKCLASPVIPLFTRVCEAAALISCCE